MARSAYFAPIMHAPGANKGFEAWLRKVDDALPGLSHLDLTDIAYRDLWEEGVTPSEAAREALEASGFEE